MHQFQDGDEARILRRGVEVEVRVFRQSGELVYIFDMENRPYQLHVRDVLPVRRGCADTSEHEVSIIAEHNGV